jgi:hypothetical protein
VRRPCKAGHGLAYQRGLADLTGPGQYLQKAARLGQAAGQFLRLGTFYQASHGRDSTNYSTWIVISLNILSKLNHTASVRTAGTQNNRGDDDGGAPGVIFDAKLHQFR